MDNNFQKKIQLIKKINIDDSNFIIKVYEAYQKHKKQIEKKKELSKIVTTIDETTLTQNTINLDTICVKPYFYTKMRLKLDYIIQQILNTDETEFISNPSNICSKIVFHEINKTFEKPENEIDIVEFIKSINKNNSISKKDFIFIAKEKDEETLFKEEQLKKAIEIINIDKKAKRYEVIYDEIYNFLENDFILLQAFLNKKQRKHLVFDFYQPKQKIIKKLIISKDKI